MSMRSKLTPTQIELVQNAINHAIADGYCPYNPKAKEIPNNCCITEVSRRLGLPYNLITKTIETGKIELKSDLYDHKQPHKNLFDAMRHAGIEITSDEKSRRNLRRLMDETQKLRKEIEAIDRHELTMEEIRTKVYELPLHCAPIPNWVIEPKTKAGGPGIPMTFWSDWHYGEVVEAEAMSHKNAFNLEIADARIEHLVDRIIDVAKYHQVQPDYPGIIVALGGDMFSGDGLHEEIDDTNQGKTIGLFMRLQGRLIWAIEKLADQFGQVYLPCDFGNHGRNSKKPRYKLRAETNYEFLLYNQLEFYFHNNPNYADKVNFDISTGAGVHFTVGKNTELERPGHRYFLTHGDTMGVKGGDGIIGSIGPIKRGSLKIGDSERSIGRAFDTLLIGHWHQYIPIQGLIANGSLKGWCDYARLALRAPYAPPTQAMWFNHPIHGPITHHKIILKDGFEKPTTPTPTFPAQQTDTRFVFCSASL